MALPSISWMHWLKWQAQQNGNLHINQLEVDKFHKNFNCYMAIVNEHMIFK